MLVVMLVNCLHPNDSYSLNLRITSCSRPRADVTLKGERRIEVIMEISRRVIIPTVTR